MKRILLSAVFSVMSILVFAQFQHVSITDIQSVPSQDLANCIDTSSYLGDTVIITGMAIHDGGLTELASSGAAGYRPGLWLVDTASNSALAPFAAIQVHGRTPDNDQVDEIDGIAAGWVISVVGAISEFDGETQFNPIGNTTGSIAGGADIEIHSTNGTAPSATYVDLGELNNSSRENQLPTGEQWEGSYVELRNLTVTAVNYFSGGSRVSFDVMDANGNVANVSDRFLAQKLPSWVPLNNQSPATAGSFVVPPVGAQFDTLRGIVIHSQNGCTGATGRGYEINPFKSSDYVYGATPPIISNVMRNPSLPTSTDNVDITATITDFDGTVTTAELFYDINASGNFTTVTMNLVGGSTDEYTAQIPAQTEGTIVRYYIEATDNENNMNTIPAIGYEQYTVRDNGLTIYDIQYVLDPSADNDSPYLGDTVTVTGIVTASAKQNDLGHVYIQQEGETEWAGISLVGNSDLIKFFRGQEITVTGVVEENYDFTRISVVDVDTTGNYGTIDAVVLDPSDAALYTNANLEKYESMLLTFTNPSAGSPMVVVDPDLGFGEFGIGNNIGATDYMRVLAGRSDNSSFSSLYVSLITDTFYINNQGEIEVDSIYLTEEGTQLDSLTGILHYSFSNYKLFPRNNTDLVGLADSSGNELVIDSTIIPLPDTTTGIVNIAGKSVNMVVYPNPANDVITVAFEQEVSAAITVMDLSGRAVLTTRTAGNATRVSTSNLPNGIYLMQITTEAGELLSTEKLVIKH